MKKMLAPVLFQFIFLSLSCGQTAVQEISPKAAAGISGSDTIFVDVREKYETDELAYDKNGIIYIPLSELDKRYTELPADQTIIVACRSGSRSKQAINILKDKGYMNLINLTGGINEWIKSGLPVINRE
jgi:rhodanese-related sulfurtransferase